MTFGYGCIHGVMDKCVCGNLVAQELTAATVSTTCGACGFSVVTPNGPAAKTLNYTTWNQTIRRLKQQTQHSGGTDDGPA